MAVVRGVKEKVHLPLYDARKFDNARPTIREQINGNLIKFFVDVQNKTKLETNQQESGVLSHYNTYEVRALRVIVQPLAAATATGTDEEDFISNFIYNSVTTLIVGEKIMIQAPTWMFPSGAGEANDGRLSHGTASPEATFRFAEPIHIDSQQNFRVEIEFPNGTAMLGAAAVQASKETRIWVMLDGYITRDVQ
jgi:hypothetical protein